MTRSRADEVLAALDEAANAIPRPPRSPRRTQTSLITPIVTGGAAVLLFGLLALIALSLPPRQEVGPAGSGVGAATASAEQATPSPPQLPSASPSSDGSPCYHITGSIDPVFPTVAIQGSLFDTIFVAVYEGDGAPFWRTANGVWPTSEFEAVDAGLYTPIAVSATTMLRGEPSSAAMTAILGGEIGCTSVRYEGGVELAAGARYVFFAVGPLLATDGTSSGHWTLGAAWPVGANDIVVTPHDGSMALAELADELARYPKQSPGASLPY